MNEKFSESKMRIPRLIVIGLTGPVGSGCSTISKFFHDSDKSDRSKGNDLLNKLRKDKIVETNKERKYVVNWNVVNKYVDERYSHRASGQPKKGEGSLRDRLEKREQLKAFDFLAKYYTEQDHLFRTLSVSDLIVFHALMRIEKKENHENWREFIDVANENIEDIREEISKVGAGIESINEYYDIMKDTKNLEEPEKMLKLFRVIHSNVKIIKENFYNKYPNLYTSTLQDFGDNIRSSGDPFKCEPNRSKKNCYKLAEDICEMINLINRTRQASFFIVDCLRNPYEVLYLRGKFSNFFLFSVFSQKEVRLERSRKNRLHVQTRTFNEDYFQKEFDKSDYRDSGMGNLDCRDRLYRQDVTKCVQISDIAITNKEEDWEGLYDKILRIVLLILSPGCTKPTLDEMYMNMAYTMSVKSNCISRQVGAVIKVPKGYIVGAGWNEAPRSKIDCGLRTLRDLAHDKEFLPIVKALLKSVGGDGEETVEELTQRLCEGFKGEGDGKYPNQACFCFKDEMAKKSTAPRLKEAWQQMLSEDQIDDEDQRLSLKDGGEKFIDELVERGELHQLDFCLALHAEENALVQSARIGGTGMNEGTIYTTDQPCPICAKKIEQAGITKVVYTEPYPASLPRVFLKRAKLVQFEGIKPRAYIKLFMPNHDQKEWQELERNGLVPEFM